MIIAHEYPVCEYDTGRDPIIRPADFLKKSLPEKCVITFFRKELEEFVKEHSLPVIGHLHSEVLDIPIYTYESGQKRLCITMPFSTAPGAAGTIEELHAMGCDKFVICGAAGKRGRRDHSPGFGCPGRGNIISLHCPFTGNLVS